MKKSISKYYTLLALICLFAAPGIAAYLFYSHPTWLGSARTNKGNLLSQPIELASIAKKDKWRIMLWVPNTCDSSCLKQLDMLARVRLALGRKLYLVDQLLVVDKNSISALMEKELTARDFMVQELSATDKQQLAPFGNEARIFIMDPERYLVLSYQSDVKPDDVYKDLKLLLTTYETKKG
ncbi:hypothetical protein [Legionella sp. km772]|uniref:hypothetical protein n=1 Tax=Legionella sp. km772 TaxID=2498111 RepID=UPI000F8F17C5|nr:hypothetical protein [Legionella sp. km772]RUR08362.1 hypothetical protein ELY15_11105 [Legionella sp. km772]